MNKATLAIAVASGVGLAIGSGPAQAQDADFGFEGVNGSIGGGGILVPEYLGSEDTEFEFLPLIDVNYRNTVFLRYDEGVNLNPVQGIGYNFLSRQANFNAGVSVNYVVGRDPDDSNIIQQVVNLDPDFGEVDDSVEVGVWGEAGFSFFKFDASYRVDLADGHDGQVLELGGSAATFLDRERRFWIGARAGALWGNQDYNQAMWATPAGFPNATSAQSNREAGWQELNFGVTGKFKVTQNFSAVAHARLIQFIDQAEDSDLVQEDFNYLLGIGVTYDF